MTRSEAEQLGWSIWSADREPRWEGDDETTWWYAEIARPLHREMAPDLEQLLSMVEAYTQHRSSRGLEAPTVPVKK